jgi:hypothetical protein
MNLRNKKINEGFKISFLKSRINDLNELSIIPYSLEITDQSFQLCFRESITAKQQYYIMDTKDLNRIFVYVHSVIQHLKLVNSIKQDQINGNSD